MPSPGKHFLAPEALITRATSATLDFPVCFTSKPRAEIGWIFNTTYASSTEPQDNKILCHHKCKATATKSQNMTLSRNNLQHSMHCKITMFLSYLWFWYRQCFSSILKGSARTEIEVNKFEQHCSTYRYNGHFASCSLACMSRSVGSEQILHIHKWSFHRCIRFFLLEYMSRMWHRISKSKTNYFQVSKKWVRTRISLNQNLLIKQNVPEMQNFQTPETTSHLLIHKIR